MMLAPCRHRSAETVHHNGRDRYICSHPQVARPNPTELVVAQQCEECPYVNFEAAVARYSPASSDGPTLAEHAARVAFCRGCEHRADNHCHLAGGSCSLAQKLSKPDFCCPQGRFEAIKR